MFAPFKTVMGTHLSLFLSGLLLFGGRAAAEVVLVKDGQPRAAIVTADEPSLIAAYAARELADHVMQASGAALPVATESQVSPDWDSRIFVGVTRAAAAQGIEPDKLDNDAFLLRTVGNDLYVVGREEKSAPPLSQNHGYSGTMFGVSEILERYLEVRWLWPGKLGAYVPRRKTIAVGEADEIVRPKLLFRDISYGTHRNLFKAGDGPERKLVFDEYPELYRTLSFSTPDRLVRYVNDLEIFMRRHRLGRSQPLKEEAEYMRKNRIASRSVLRMPQVDHAFDFWWQAYGKKHPDWFALRDNGARGAKPGEPPYSSMCVSSPDLRRFIIDKVVRPGRAHNVWCRTIFDGRAILDLGEADIGGDGLCKCPACLAWDGPQNGNPPVFAADKYEPKVVTERYVRFWKTIYDRAAQKVPDLKMLVYLYHNFFPAPTRAVKFSPNVIGEFVVYGENGGWYPMTRAEDRWTREQWLGWRRTGMSLVLRPNYMLSGYVMPEITTRPIADFFNFAYRNGMMAVYFDSLRDHWAANGPMSYLHYRLLWDPELTAAEIRREYFAAFGPAAGLVEEYFDYWEEHVHREAYLNARPPIHDKESGMTIEWYPMMRRAAGSVVAFPERVYPPAEKTLDRALAAARKDPLPEYAERVRFLQDGLEHAKLSARIWRFLKIDSYGTASPPDDAEKLAKARQAMRALIEFRRAHQDPYVADYVAAFADEKGILNIKALLPGSEDILAREAAFQSRWPDRAVRSPGESKLRLKTRAEIPRTGWRFRRDPDRQGDELKWHLPDTPDHDWQQTQIAKFWADDYVGIGWYRGRFESPKPTNGCVAYLHFGAVDESCWVWVNGVYVGRHDIGPEGWDKPFRLDITDPLKPGGNFIAIRARNVGYAGGIWKPVTLELHEPAAAGKSGDKQDGAMR